MKGLSGHSRTVCRGKKKLPVDYRDKGSRLDLDANGNLMFSRLDFATILPKEELGEREVCLAILAGRDSKSLVPMRPQTAGASRSPSKQAVTCPFGFGTFVTTEVSELHLKARQHIHPNKSPYSSEISGVQGHPPLWGLHWQHDGAASAIHLLSCRRAPKDSSSDLQIQPNFTENSEALFVKGEVIPDSSLSVKRKLPNGHFGAEDQGDVDGGATSGHQQRCSPGLPKRWRARCLWKDKGMKSGQGSCLLMMMLFRL